MPYVSHCTHGQQSEEANLNNLQQEEPDPAGAGPLVNNGLPQASNAAVVRGLVGWWV